MGRRGPRPKSRAPAFAAGKSDAPRASGVEMPTGNDMQEKMIVAGDVIYREGDPGSALYLVNSGKVEVLRAVGDRNVRLAVFGEGEIFGEMSVIRDQPHTTTMRAVDQTRLTVVPKDAFLKSFQDDNPFQYLLLRTLCNRLAKVDEQLIEQQIFSEAARVSVVEQMVLLPESPEMAIQIGEKGVPVEILMPFRVGGKAEVGAAAAPVANDIDLLPIGRKSLSPTHFAIEERDGRVVLHDLGSKLGTLVNGQRVAHFERSQYADLMFGENTIQIGGTNSPFCFRLIIERTVH